MAEEATDRQVLRGRYDRKSAAHYLSISVSQFRALLRRSDLPKGQRDSGGRKLYWTRATLDDYITKRDAMSNPAVRLSNIRVNRTIRG